MSDFTFTTKTGGDFERPATGMYHGVLADIVDLGMVTTTFQGTAKTQRMCRFVWLLDKNGKDGKPLQVNGRFGVNLHEKSNLYKHVKQVLNAAPPLNLNPESLIGQVRKLFVQQEETGAGEQKKVYANIIGVSPADAGATALIPADFVRDKNKPVEQQAKNKKPKQNSGNAQGQTQAPAANQGADIAF